MFHTYVTQALHLDNIFPIEAMVFEPILQAVLKKKSRLNSLLIYTSIVLL